MAHLNPHTFLWIAQVRPSWASSCRRACPVPSPNLGWKNTGRHESPPFALLSPTTAEPLPEPSELKWGPKFDSMIQNAAGRTFLSINQPQVKYLPSKYPLSCEHSLHDTPRSFRRFRRCQQWLLHHTAQPSAWPKGTTVLATSPVNLKRFLSVSPCGLTCSKSLAQIGSPVRSFNLNQRWEYWHLFLHLEEARIKMYVKASI